MHSVDGTQILWILPERELFCSFRSYLERSCKSVTYFYIDELIRTCSMTRVKKLILSAVKQVDVVLVTLYSDTFVISPAFLSVLRQEAPVMLWMFDDEIYSTFQTVNYIGAIDGYRGTDKSAIELFESVGIPSSYQVISDQQEEVGLNGSEKVYDISFIGDITTGNRMKYIRHLQDCGLSVTVFGKGSKNGRVSKEVYNEVIRSSRICLNFTETQVPEWILRAEPWRKFKDQHKGRPTEIVALKTLCISERTKDRSAFPFKTLPMFSDAEELVSLCRLYLSDQELMSNAISASHKEYEAKLSHEVQVGVLLNDIADLITRYSKSTIHNRDSDNEITLLYLKRRRGWIIKLLIKRLRDLQLRNLKEDLSCLMSGM